ncbi:MAG: Cytochrome c oxidase polypeptide I, partial [uncultured Gemmatimonadetes bacterium]
GIICNAGRPARARGRARRADGTVELDHHGRPQADRHHVRRHGLLLLPGGRHRGAADPGAAGRAQQQLRQRRAVQPALHHARADDDLRGADAADGRVLQLHHPAADRGARRGVPAAERAVVLGLLLRRDLLQRQHPDEAGPELGVVRVRAHHHQAVLARHQHGLLRPGPADPGAVLHHRVAELHRHHHQHARAGNAADAHAHLHLADADHEHPDRDGHGGVHHRHHRADVRPGVRHAVLQRGRGRRPAALAAPVLDVRPPRGVHPDPSHHGNGVGGASHVQPQAALRLQRDGVLGGADRLAGLGRVEPPHVRGGHGPHRRQLLRPVDDAHRHSHGHQGVQLAGNHVGGRHPLHHGHAVLHRVHRHVHHRRDLGGDARGGALGPAADRHVLRRGAPALRVLRRHGAGAVVGHLLLVPQDHGAAAERAGGQGALLADPDRHEPDLLPHALPGDAGHAAAHLHLRRQHGLQRDEPGHLGGLVHHRAGHPGLRHQPGGLVEVGEGGGAQPVGRAHAGVVHPVAPAGVQLPPHPGGALAHAPVGGRPHQGRRDPPRPGGRGHPAREGDGDRLGRHDVPRRRKQDVGARPGHSPAAAVVLAHRAGRGDLADLNGADLPHDGRAAPLAVAADGGGGGRHHAGDLQVRLRARARAL